MRGSLRINFQLNSIHQFLEYTFRLQQFLNIFISSDLAQIPNLGIPMEVIYKSETRFSISFSIFEKEASKHWGTLKKQLSFWAARA